MLSGIRVFSIALIAALGALAMSPVNANVITLNGSGTISTPSYEFLDPSGSANVETNNNVSYALTIPFRRCAGWQLYARHPWHR